MKQNDNKFTSLNEILDEELKDSKFSKIFNDEKNLIRDKNKDYLDKLAKSDKQIQDGKVVKVILPDDE